MGLIKWAAAEMNKELGLLDEPKRTLIVAGRPGSDRRQARQQFVVDIFQTGSGTSTNMNANEVIATRANEIATGKRGGKEPVHPNDHVNMQQSSNDVIPTAMHVAAAVAIKESLIPSLQHLARDAQQEGASNSTTSSRSAGRTCRMRRRSGSGRRFRVMRHRPAVGRTRRARFRCCANCRWVGPRSAPASTRIRISRSAQ